MCAFLVGMQNGIAIWKILIKLNIHLSYDPTISLFKRHENMLLPKDSCKIIHNHTIYYNPKLETTQIFINNRMFFKKPTYNGPLLRNFFKKMNCWYMNNVEESKKKVKQKG